MDIYTIFPEIRKNRIFTNANETIVKKYLSGNSLIVSEFKAQDVIISPSTKVIKVGIVIEGKIEIFSPESTHKVLLKTAGKGNIFGIAGLFADEDYFPTQISAKTDTKILFVSPDAFRALLDADAVLMKNFLNFLSTRIAYLNKKIVSYTAGNTEQKLAYFIFENSPDGYFSTDVSISDIAVMLDMGRASLYRAFESLENEGIISRDGRSICVLDKEKLKKIYTN